MHFFYCSQKSFFASIQLDMRKKGFLFLLLTCFIAIGCANGADRSTINTSTRTNILNNHRARATISIRSKNKSTSAVRSTTGRSATTSQSQNQTKTSRSTKTRQIVSSRSGLLYSPRNAKKVVGRAATLQTNSTPTSFGAEYETCRDAYFACMDQFCAYTDETYRRCICSSRLNEIKQKQSAITNSSDSLNNFHDLNMDVINKSTEEVRAMTSATIGEQIASSTSDKSDSAQQLSAISDVLSKTKSKSLSTAGTLDAGGDIKSIWTTTDLASGANIANLTGESLYNAVNAQCSEMVESQCSSSILNMVISAYGMYIENDCSALNTNLIGKKNSANAAIRETGREMSVARLDSYNAHNSLSINDCISSIRKDLTANTACGTDFVHCWDVTGLYLNIDTGEPIYSTNFYNLENQISLSGNILNNQTNHMIVNTLNNKKVYAQSSLDKCRDLSNDIWDEFMRQAIIEIHQKQLEKIRDVKTECLSVVNQCYDTKRDQLKDFSNVKDNTLLGLKLETVEDLCREKLDTCSNLYGGGPDGLAELVNTMHKITDQRIVAECQNLLIEFGNNLCSVPSTDTLHAYPYSCRVYAPGDQKYATIAACNNATSESDDCGDSENNYVNSLYQRFVHYAMQVCIRPSEYENLANEVPTLVLQDINIVMDKMRISMGQELSKECERTGGIWVTTPYPSSSSIELQEKFYTETGTNKTWGYCKSPTTPSETYTITFVNDNNDGNKSTAVVTYGETMADVAIPAKTVNSNHTDITCVFLGYFTSRSGGTQYYDENGKATKEYDISNDTILYAHWQDENDTNGTNCSSLYFNAVVNH